jgi:peptidoglycan/LPS O-acetylase OafA/YrhL
MSAFDSKLVQQDRLLPGIHGLRGIAALAVVLYHLNHIGGIQPPPAFGFIGRDFGFSVHLFFIVSAYSLMYSTQSKVGQPNWLFDYFVKRYFRIAPLWYAMIAFFIGYGFYIAKGWKTVPNLIMSLTFSFGFAPETGIVWGGWSVGAEMIFYGFFPVLILAIRSRRAALIFAIITTLIACAIRSELHNQYLKMTPPPMYDWSYFSFSSNACFFAMGLFAYRFAAPAIKDTVAVRFAMPAVAIAIIGSLLFLNVGARLYYGSRLDIVLWGIGFTALTIWQGARPSRLVANRFLEFLGERSFSIYLLHPVVIVLAKARIVQVYDSLLPSMGMSAYFVSALLLMMVILICAELTYRLIELPGINLGRKILKRKSRNLAPPAP